ncbi:hypothetical protein B6J52_24780 [Klebsiella pneumoniae]|nr:hypothetical protein B6J52_24780 [Klebsiella pneumoniae]
MACGSGHVVKVALYGIDSRRMGIIICLRFGIRIGVGVTVGIRVTVRVGITVGIRIAVGVRVTVRVGITVRVRVAV